MSFVETTAPFFADMGQSATVGGSAMMGIFDDDYQGSLGFVDGTQPSLLVASAGLSGVTVGTAVTVNSASYTVTSLRPEGAAMTRLMLQEA